MPNPTICFIGDSLTEGTYSVDWVTNLSKKFPSINFINKGNNGETSALVRTRIKTDVIDLNPEFVVVLIGGNDIIGATHNEAGKMYVEMFPEIQKEPPTYEQYKIEMETIIKTLDKDLPKNTQILILSPPPIGEGGMDSPEWNLGAKCSKICEEIVLESSDRVLFSDLYTEVMRNMIFHINGDYVPLKLSLFNITVCRVLSIFLKWETIRWLYGYKYTTDGIHFCSEFGNICEHIVIDWLLADMTT
tara:strand:- start:771 stop:1508 length:738 start_codon:yes stop_codon:yes gene_type:complete